MGNMKENKINSKEGETLDADAATPAIRFLTTEQLLLLDQTFAAWVAKARGKRSSLSRNRCRLVFLLLRHTGAKLGEVLAIDDREVTNALDHVARFQSRFFSDAGCHDLADHRCGPRADNADFSKQLGIGIRGIELAERQHDRTRRCAGLVAKSELQIPTIERALRQAPAQVFK